MTEKLLPKVSAQCLEVARNHRLCAGAEQYLARIETLEAALRFYADLRNYRPVIPVEGGPPTVISLDRGKRARRALEDKP